MGEGLLTARTLRERFKAIPSEAREADQPFSIRVWRGLSWLERAEAADGRDVLGKILWAEQLTILRLIDSKYLFRPFWLGQPDADEKLQRPRQQAMRAYQRRGTLSVLQELFERLYVMRQQVFHGAATSGSKLNRTALKRCTAVLTQVMPAVIEILIAAGPETDWGEVCFPPVSE